MSLATTIAMFVTCMAPLFLVYFAVGGIHMLQLDKTAYVSEKTDFDATAEFKSYIVLCAAFVVACAVLSICIAMFARWKRADKEHARRKTTSGNVRQRDDGGMKWFDIDLLKDDTDVDEEGEKRFHFFNVDDVIGDASLEGDSSDEDVEKRSPASLGRSR